MSEHPAVMTAEERLAFLAEPRTAVVAVASGGARPPLAVPVWFDFNDAGNFVFFTQTGGTRPRKVPLLRKAGVATVLVEAEGEPYRYVRAEGTVVGIEQPGAKEQAIAVAARYMPYEDAVAFIEAEHAHPDCRFTLITIRPDRWDSMDLGKTG